MKKTFLLGLATVFAACASLEAGLISEWNFSGALGPSRTTTTWAAENNSGASGVSTLSSASAYSIITAPSATFANGASTPAIRYTGSNPTVTFSITPSSTVQQFQIKYVARTDAANQGASVNKWTITSGSQTLSVTINPRNTAWTPRTIDFTNIGGAANVPVTITLEQSGNNGSHFTDYDTIQINAVPEPANIALGLFGVGAVGIAVGRRVLASRKAASKG